MNKKESFAKIMLGLIMVSTLFACDNSKSSDTNDAVSESQTIESSASSTPKLVDDLGNFFDVRPGMTKDEVINLMGEPSKKKGNSLIYYVQKINLPISISSKGDYGNDCTYSFRFEHEKLVSMWMDANFSDLDALKDYLENTVVPMFKDKYPDLKVNHFKGKKIGNKMCYGDLEVYDFIAYTGKLDEYGFSNSAFKMYIAKDYPDSITILYDESFVRKEPSENTTQAKSDNNTKDGVVGDNNGDGIIDDEDWESEWKDYINQKMDEYAP